MAVNPWKPDQRLSMSPSSSGREHRRRRRACGLPMAEPHAMAQSGPAASERDVLLATKLHLPGSRPDLVSRPRLAARLDAGLAQVRRR